MYLTVYLFKNKPTGISFKGIGGTTVNSDKISCPKGGGGGIQEGGGGAYYKNLLPNGGLLEEGLLELLR